MIKYRLTVLVALSIVASGTLNFAHVVLIDSDVDARLTAWLLWAVSGFGAIGLYWAVGIPLLSSRNNRAYNPVSDPPKTSATTFNPEFQPPPLPDEQASSNKNAPKKRFLMRFISSLITSTEIAWRTKFSIEGRSTRGEYWRFQLVYFLTLIFLLLLTKIPVPVMAYSPALLIFLIPSQFCLQVRRFHDLNRSGWWLLLSGIPYGIGGFLILFWFCFAGTKGYNKYGPDPLGKHAESPPPMPTEPTQDRK